jgi:hypothetical protein
MTAGDDCPRCDAPNARVVLLTSMARYFVCAQCHCRWHISLMCDHEREAKAEDDPIETPQPRARRPASQPIQQRPLWIQPKDR